MKFSFIILLLIFLSSLTINSYGQKALAIGDKVPDITISNIINFNKPTANLSDFRGKLLIIDFWATWCSPCVAMLPKNDSLQKEFEGKVQFLPVSNETENTVTAFLRKVAALRHITVPSVVGDTLLRNMFIHHYIPYYIWIDPEGKVIATTEENQVNAKNIRSILAGNSSQIVKYVGMKNKILNPKRPFFIDEHSYLNKETDTTSYVEPVSASDILYQSTLSKYIPNISSTQACDSNHFVATNSAIINLYRLYFGLRYKKSPLLFWSKSRNKIEVRDSLLADKINTSLTGQRCTDWLKTNGYNYELIWKCEKSWKEKLNLLGDDLERYFSKPLKITVDLEKRATVSDVLVDQDQGAHLKTIGGAPYEKHDKFSYIQRNEPLSAFISQLETHFWQTSDRAIFDETTFKGNVDLELNCDMTDEKAINIELAKYGLKFIDGERMTDVLIFKDR